MEEQTQNQKLVTKKIPWYNNFKWYHTLIFSIILFIIYFNTEIALFDYAAVVGTGFSIWQIVKAIKNKND